MEREINSQDRETDLIIDSDASPRGWGARCHLKSTGDPWLEEEKRIHINCLELLAATLAVKSFAKHNQNFNSAEDRQHHGNGIHKSSGGTISHDLVKWTKNLWM